MYPTIRPRRLRSSAAIRRLAAETELSLASVVAPLFVKEGSGIRDEISSMPGHFHLSPELVVAEAGKLLELGVSTVLLFGLPETKDDTGSMACNPNGVVQQAVRHLKSELPDLAVAVDLCFCEYTSHGHCGVIVNEQVDNDLTLAEISKQALSLAEAGADIIAPSGMMDGAVGVIRDALEENEFYDTVIMGYSVKYASAYYGPFREAVDSAPCFGDRLAYQMDPKNSDEALREVNLDIEEGADIVMVKPALPYLDIIRRIKDEFAVPLAAYNVSGEYSMIKNAVKQGLVDEDTIIYETLLSIKRAGADIIITYFAEDLARILRAGRF